MIEIGLLREKDGFIRRITVKGHAGYAEAGSDIVCAAVSVTAYTAAGALNDLAGIGRCWREKDGYMRITIPQDITMEQKATAGIILETTAIGFRQIEEAYKTFVKVLDEEV